MLKLRNFKFITSDSMFKTIFNSEDIRDGFKEGKEQGYKELINNMLDSVN